MAFFDKLDWAPNSIVFVDDLLDNLKEVHTACKKRNISFLGIHCLLAHLQESLLNPEKTQKQIAHLLQEGEWLCDIKV